MNVRCLLAARIKVAGHNNVTQGPRNLSLGNPTVEPLLLSCGWSAGFTRKASFGVLSRFTGLHEGGSFCLHSSYNNNNNKVEANRSAKRALLVEVSCGGHIYS
jgi:hypothetical protein